MRAFHLLFVLFFVSGLVGCDHATKGLAVAHLQGNAPMELLPGVLELTYTENHDMAFGLLAAFTTADQRYPFLIVMKMAGVLVALTVLIVRFGRSGWLEKLGVTAVAAGAIGNLLDRAFRGFVVDFIHVSYWPVFNVADIAVVLGGACLLYAAHVQGKTAASAPTPFPRHRE